MPQENEGSGAGTQHLPVMVGEVLAALSPRPGMRVLDATVGGGGHAEAILERTGPDGLLIGLDRDPVALQHAHERLARFGDRVRLVNRPFDRLADVVEQLAPGGVDGILFDLGVSSFQLEVSLRGFGYADPEAPLDMRMDPSAPMTAAQWLNQASPQEIARVLWEYGEERWASRIAQFIVERRARSPLATAGDLVACIKAAIPAAARRRGGHPARRSFQAIRIAINDELGQLSRALPQAAQALAPGGRLVVISFHSLEDRIVKRAFREIRGLEPLTRKPVEARPEEVDSNPRARSARLRVARRVLPADAEE